MAGRSVAVLAFDGMTPFEMGVVVEVFGLPRPELRVPWYTLRVCSQHPGSALRAVGGFALTVDHGLDDFAAADTLIVPGVADVTAPVGRDLIDALRTAHARGARIASICSGAFALAAAGLLDGRDATTHWRDARLLQRRYPNARVNPSVVYTDNGDILTSAGGAAGLDLCLHIVRRDHGPRVANALARRLVIAPHRDGNQAQFMESGFTDTGFPDPPGPAHPDAARGTGHRGAGDRSAVGRHLSIPTDDTCRDDDDRITASMQWARRNLHESLSVSKLARQAHMSARTFNRHFARVTGTTPIRWLIAQRVAASLPLLETSDAPIEDVCSAVGFGDVATFRHHFGRAMQTSPSAYRRAFRGRAS